MAVGLMRPAAGYFVGCLSLKRTTSLFWSFPTRNLQVFEPEEPHSNVVIPNKFRLPPTPRVPSEWLSLGAKAPRGVREVDKVMGEERVNHQLQLGQYGIVALSGGSMKHEHFEYLRHRVSRYLEDGVSFAFYRVDTPYKPWTSKSGKRLGGGKGSIKHYVTHVKAGRIILEVAGKVSWEETHPWLSRIARNLPFEAIAVNQDILDRLNAEERRLAKINTNPYTLEWMIRNNIFDCQRRLSPFDVKWFGKFTYMDRHNNKKWNQVLFKPYKSK